MSRTGQQLRQRTIQAMATSARTTKAAPKIDRAARLRYWFDNSMSAGTPALIAWLGVLTAVLIAAFALFVLATGWAPADDSGRRPGFFRLLFSSLMHALDPGTVAGDAGPWRFLLTMLLLTLGGLFIVSALIGVIATGIDARIAGLQRGRSLVVESDHTVILGWSEAVFTLIRELAIANESRRRGVVAILADRDKVDMEEEVRAKVPDLRGTRVVCRSGSPLDIADLALTSFTSARSVIVLADAADTDPDVSVIKVSLALSQAGGFAAPVVAEISDPANLDVASLAGGGRVALVDKRLTVARLIVQSARQSGAAAVYADLFDFDGSEIYFHADHGRQTDTYAEAARAFENLTVIGWVNADGSTELNPPAGELVAERALIVLAEDDRLLSSPRLSSADVDRSSLVSIPPAGPRPTRSLVIGWNQRADTVLAELDAYSDLGSTVTIVAPFGAPKPLTLDHLATSVVLGASTDRAVLADVIQPGLDHIIVLNCTDDLPPQDADAATLMTLLLVRDLVRDFERPPAVVSELADDRNRALAAVARVDDVIVSDQILSLILGQIAENPGLAPVFDDLLDEAGSEIYLRPASDYVRAGSTVSFATLLVGATTRGETAIGYRRAAEVQAGHHGVVLNPAKSATFSVQPGDRLIVLAED